MERHPAIPFAGYNSAGARPSPSRRPRVGLIVRSNGDDHDDIALDHKNEPVRNSLDGQVIGTNMG